MNGLKFCRIQPGRAVSSGPFSNKHSENLNSILYTTRPPFAWNMLMKTAEKMRGRLDQREELLKRNLNILVSINEKDSCSNLGNLNSGEFNEIVTNYSEEDLKNQSCENIVFWLSKASTSEKKIDISKTRKVVKENAILFRKKQMFSFMRNGNTDISYYSSADIEEQLVEMTIQASLKIQGGYSKLAIAASIMGHFLAIHPFEDGNGRAARNILQRVLQNLNLLKGTLPLGHLAQIDRKNYIIAMRGLSINGNYEQFLEYVSLWIAAASDLSVLKFKLNRAK